MGTSIVTSAALLCVLARDSLDPGLVGLSLSYAFTSTKYAGMASVCYLCLMLITVVVSVAISFTELFHCSWMSWFVRSTAEVEMAMNSIERVDYYTSTVQQESPVVVDLRSKPPVNWPSEGEVTFSNVVLKYRADSEVRI